MRLVSAPPVRDARGFAAPFRSRVPQPLEEEQVSSWWRHHPPKTVAASGKPAVLASGQHWVVSTPPVHQSTALANESNLSPLDQVGSASFQKLAALLARPELFGSRPNQSRFPFPRVCPCSAGSASSSTIAHRTACGAFPPVHLRRGSS